MRKFWAVNSVLLGFSSAAHAGHSQAFFTQAPVLGDAGLVALALGMGLGGAWAIRKYRDR